MDEEILSVHGQSSTSTNQLPLSMQTSSQLIQNGLDIEHGRGGERITPTEDVEIPSLKSISNYNVPLIESSCSPSGGSQANTPDTLISMPETEENPEFDDSDHCPLHDSNMSGSLAVDMEFDILDELESDDDDFEMGNMSTDSDDDISDEEIDDMLDNEFDSQREKAAVKAMYDEVLAHEDKEKVVLKVKGKDHFDLLPEGWVDLTHNSGMPVYLHKQSRVCCMSKPYFLGSGSTRKHEIPISAIPCLHYSKEIEKEKQEHIEKEQLQNKDEAGDKNMIVPSASLECVEDSKKQGSLDAKVVREYCEKRFEFETIMVKRFKTWFGRRKHIKSMKQKQRPTLPGNTKLITCPVPVKQCNSENGTAGPKKEFVMNPNGKSAICILHEYVQHTLRVQPHYVFKELENASTPYGAVVVINDMEYGSGFGSSKKQAKAEAAKSALEVLIPKMRLINSEGKPEKDATNLDFFDEVRVEDPRVCELCVKAGQPYPYQILLECLRRNYGMGNTKIDFKMRNLRHQRNEFTMTVGKHIASVVCKNKRDGKQRASQAVLQLLHPQIHSWGSLLRMYGIGSRQTLKEKKVEEQRITELQSKACANKPNLSILNKLQEEMMLFRKMKESQKPIGKLIPEKMDFVTTSDSNLKNVEL